MQSIDMNYLNSLISRKQVTLEKAKMATEMKESLIARRSEIEYVFDRVQKYLTALEVILNMMYSESNAYKERRNAYLDSIATEETAKVFPDDKFDVHIVSKIVRGVPRSEMELHKLGDPAGYNRSPDISEGLLHQYLLSFSCVAGMVSSLGKRVIFIDEAFGAADEDNLPIIGNLINEKIQEGFQIVLISQRSGLYENIPHREFNLERDIETNKVIIKEVLDCE